MNKQKKIFVVVSLVFILVMIGFTIHIFSITNLPGRKGQLRERIEKRLDTPDSLHTDTTQH